MFITDNIVDELPSNVSPTTGPGEGEKGALQPFSLIFCWTSKVAAMHLGLGLGLGWRGGGGGGGGCSVAHLG